MEDKKNTRYEDRQESDVKYLTKREFDNFKTNEFYHVRNKVDWIFYLAITALISGIGTLVAVILK